MPPFQLPDLNDEHTLFTSNLLQGKTTLLNVWASWCAACSEEQVFLLQLARQGVPLYGLNYKDNPKDATRWLAEWGNPYKRTGNDLNGKVAIELGVYGTPETFLIDAQGVIQYRHAGPLNDEVWTREFLPRIKALEKTA
ncbi:DsbE family thiol:disulfide interchange protein [Legionella oakridgensis]|uniref:DsbE family thiol:disulfide interchange protein n=1 Tax=Legionella oakridgensis TaxID=29423 RepID=UPI001EE63E41|nr:DsbE family thiol:disulfide interchange protein [Legionella oakridgensis]